MWDLERFKTEGVHLGLDVGADLVGRFGPHAFAFSRPKIEDKFAVAHRGFTKAGGGDLGFLDPGMGQEGFDLIQKGRFGHKWVYNGVTTRFQWGETPYAGGMTTLYTPAMRIRHNWRELLAALVRGKELAPISRRAKLNSTYLRDVLERNQTPQLKSAEKLSDALGAPITDWFLEIELTGNSTQNREGAASSPSELPRLDLMPRDFPVYGSAECGDDGVFEFNYGEPIDFVKRPQRLSGVKNAYGLYASGDSMKPWRKHGELVYVHEKQPPMIGDHVVIQLKPKKSGDAPLAFIKLLEKRTGTELVVSQYNPAKKITIPLSKVVTVHRVMEWPELLGV